MGSEMKNLSSAKINNGSFNDSQALVSQPIIRIILMLSKILCGNFSTPSLLKDFQAACFIHLNWKSYNYLTVHTFLFLF